ncbi:hypothetical protein I3843_05G179100 [Carya illinoinensis]|uniref:Glutaredoxin domain-containing protein n=1 Tax=Carya illinoinensis TaxID=32201 RepID=A0A922F6G8_CARIL|nr:hypothetical protein I3842_05G195200 [Carya illinoinensis]KAG7980356.1 hypothetical protein I3843_05G179100 [Carya illinoinensis]
MEIFDNSKSSFFFNCLLTLHHRSSIVTQKKPYLQTALDWTGSDSFFRFYNSIESIRSTDSSIKGKVKQLHSFFESLRNIKEFVSQLKYQLLPSKLKLATNWIISVFNSLSIRLLGVKSTTLTDKIIVFFTSLCTVCRTYKDCYAWDVSMNYVYLEEMQMFVNGKHLGGTKVIKHLFKVGKLVRILQGFSVQKPELMCYSCGDVRFVSCSNCNGSRKIFDEDKDRVKRCLECNENGLVCYLDCCSS